MTISLSTTPPPVSPVTHCIVVPLYTALAVILSVNKVLSPTISLSVPTSLAISGGILLSPFTFQSVKSPPLVSHVNIAAFSKSTKMFWGCLIISVVYTVYVYLNYDIQVAVLYLEVGLLLPTSLILDDQIYFLGILVVSVIDYIFMVMLVEYVYTRYNKMLKDVGMEVPKAQKQSAACRQRQGMHDSRHNPFSIYLDVVLLHAIKGNWIIHT